MTPRLRTLLEHAVSAMERGHDPFSPWFVIEHDTTPDEMAALRDTLAVAGRVFLEAARADGPVRT